MSAWLQDIQTALWFIWENPWILLVALVVLLPVYALQTRIIRRSFRQIAANSVAGWSTAAKRSERAHELGIGTEEVLVLRPAKKSIGALIWPMLFFGAGGAFLAWVMISDPEEQTFENLFVVSASAGFVILCLFGLVRLLSRIEISNNAITLRRFLRPKRNFLLSQLTEVKPIKSNPALGLILIFSDGRQLKLLASYLGYMDALRYIKSHQPKVGPYTMLGSAMRGQIR